MKRIITLVLAILLSGSCNTSLEESRSYTSSCEEAKEYIYECLGYLPYLPNCTPENAEKILSTDCDGLENLWR